MQQYMYQGSTSDASLTLFMDVPFPYYLAVDNMHIQAIVRTEHS